MLLYLVGILVISLVLLAVWAPGPAIAVCFVVGACLMAAHHAPMWCIVQAEKVRRLWRNLRG